jgi:hypothetical protein
MTRKEDDFVLGITIREETREGPEEEDDQIHRDYLA